MKKSAMRRLLGVLLVLVLSAGLASCTTNPAENSLSVDANEFRLTSLPELEPFEPFTDISSRYYQEYTDRLQPAADYGRLYPYPGKVIHSDWLNETRYGLCDAQGRIVLDPVCPYINVRTFDEGPGLIQLNYLPSDVTEEDMSMYDSMEDVTYAAIDGSWVVDGLGGYLNYADQNVFVISGTDYDETYMYTTNCVYNIADGTLRSQFPMSQILACEQDFLVLGEPGANDSIIYRLADYDGETIRQLDGANIIPCGDMLITSNADGLCGITDLEGNYLVEPQYQNIIAITETEDNKYFCADTVQGTTQLITATGEVVLDIGSSATISSVNDEKYPHLYSVREHDQSISYLVDVNSGEYGPQVAEFINYIGNGWYSCSDYQGKLTVYRWGQNQPWQEITDEHYVNSWCELIQGTESTLAVQIAVEESNGNYSSDTVIYDLAAKKELARIDGVYSSYIEIGEGYAFWNDITGIYSIYDAEGKLLRDTGFTYINKIDDTHYCVANSLYGGVVDDHGQWLIRIYINTLD